MRAVDTNLVVRLLVPVETARVLDAVHERSAEQIAIAVEMLLNHKKLTVQVAEVVASALEHYRSRPALGFSDCLVVEVVRKAGHLPLGAFGRDLAKLDGVECLK